MRLRPFFFFYFFEIQLSVNSKVAFVAFPAMWTASPPFLWWSSGRAVAYWFAFQYIQRISLSSFILFTWLYHCLRLCLFSLTISCTSHCSLMSMFLIRSILVLSAIVFRVFILAIRSMLFVLFVSSHVSIP